MPQEETAAVTQPSPFSEWSSTPTIPPTVQEPFKGEKTEITDDVKDPVIKEKDENIEEEKPTSDKPNEPEKILSATPKDIPAETKEAGKPTSELSFANETSERIFNLLKEGKEDDVLDYLSQKRTLNNLDKLPHADLIKLQIKNENKDYTQQDIDDLFSEKYSLPEKPVFDDTLESEDEYKVKEDRYNNELAKAIRRIERGANEAKKDLAKLHQELVLPNIPQKEPEQNEPTQEELAQFKKQQEIFLQAKAAALQELNGYDAIFKDKDVEIPIAYKVTEEEKEAVAPLLDSLNTDLPQFFQQLNWLDKDGKPNLQKAASDLHYLLNKDAVIQKFVNEAGNKRVAEERKRQKNIDFSGQQRRGSLEPSVQEEVDKKVKGFFAAS